MIRRETRKPDFIHRKQQVNGILLKPRRILGDNDAPLITYLLTFKRDFLGFATNVCKKFLAKKWISAKVCTVAYCESLYKARKRGINLQKWKENRFLEQINEIFMNND